MKMITTDECVECAYGEINEVSKARVMVKCYARNKVYYYGQCIPCEDKEKNDD